MGYLIPTNIDVSTIYADNVVSYGMRPVHKSLDNALDDDGKMLVQNSYENIKMDI